MATQYRIHSKSFGLHFQKMATGLIKHFANAINYASRVNGRLDSYASCGIIENWPKKILLYLDVYNEQFNIDEAKLTDIINAAYYDFFLPMQDHSEIKLSIKFSEYYMDEYNKYCRDIIVEDSYFLTYHEKAIKWHLS